MTSEELQIKLQLLHDILSERWTPERFDEYSWSFRHVSAWVPLFCYAEINPHMDALIFRALHSRVEPKKRGLVNQYLTHVNFSIPVGNWAMDPNDNEVRWKSGVYFGGGELSENLIRNVIGSSLFFMYQHAVGIAKIQGGATLQEALDSVGKDHGQGIMEGMKQPG